MTREEAIEELEKLKRYVEPRFYRDGYLVALDMAIEALSADGDLINRADAENEICEVIMQEFDVPPTRGYEVSEKIFKFLPSADRPTVDCTGFIDWIRKVVADEELWNLNAVGYGEIICRKLVKLGALEETEEPPYYYISSADRPTPNYITESPNDIVEQKNDVVAKPTDLISRADAIEAIESRQTEQWIDADVDYNNGLESAVAEIKALPSAKVSTKCIAEIKIDADEVAQKIKEKYDLADRPSGEWVIRENGNKECSLCGHERQDGWDYFCGYCGAKMGSDGLYYADNRLTVEWKLASEGLPQSVGSYIVTCRDEYGSVYVDYDFWTVFDKFKYNRDKVTAWIPFPRPYCGAKKGGE